MMGGKYPGRTAEPAGCTHLGLGAEPAETIPDHLRQAPRPSKVQVTWEFVVMQQVRSSAKAAPGGPWQTGKAVTSLRSLPAG